MARDLTASVITEITAKELRPRLFFQGEFDSGNLNFWSGLGEKNFNSTVFTGSGNLLHISRVEETEEVRAAGVDFRLTGVDASIISVALNEDYQDRPCTVWFAVMDEDEEIVSTAYTLFKGRMDVMEISESAETAIITMSAENVLIDLERPKERRYTDRDQKTEFSTDDGFEFVDGIQDKEFVWGR